MDAPEKNKKKPSRWKRISNWLLSDDTTPDQLDKKEEVSTTWLITSVIIATLIIAGYYFYTFTRQNQSLPQPFSCGSLSTYSKDEPPGFYYHVKIAYNRHATYLSDLPTQTAEPCARDCTIKRLCPVTINGFYFEKVLSAQGETTLSFTVPDKKNVTFDTYIGLDDTSAQKNVSVLFIMRYNGTEVYRSAPLKPFDDPLHWRYHPVKKDDTIELITQKASPECSSDFIAAWADSKLLPK